eukprot:TRINITY_DN4848_c0_g1_i1.p1 TRINITY_DN4848_c0_g1~~TRINITY_DN4848_c0_g1_i1.p1  ORF type:complete len:555 (-),score=84.70 TRINITY_DN4848_c0_g1_i1:3-1667(-)
MRVALKNTFAPLGGRRYSVAGSVYVTADFAAIEADTVDRNVLTADITDSAAPPKKSRERFRLTSRAEKAPVRPEPDETTCRSPATRQTPSDSPRHGSTPKATRSTTPTRKQTAQRGVEGKTTKTRKMLDIHRARLHKSLIEEQEVIARHKLQNQSLGELVTYEVYEAKIVELSHERDEGLIHIRVLQEEVSKLRAQTEDLRRRGDELFRRNIDYEARIQKLEAFDAASHELMSDYTSAEEIVSVIEALRHNQAALQNQLQAATLKLVHSEEVQHREKTKWEETERLLQNRVASLESDTKRLEAELRSAHKAVAEAGLRAKNTSDLESAHRAVVDMVFEWYSSWKTKAAEYGYSHSTPEPALQSLRENPIIMIKALMALSDQFNPSRAGMLYREICEIAARVCHDLLRNEDGFRQSPAKTFRRVAELASNRLREVTGLQSNLAQSREDLARVRAELETLRCERTVVDVTCSFEEISRLDPAIGTELTARSRGRTNSNSSGAVHSRTKLRAGTVPGHPSDIPNEGTSTFATRTKRPVTDSVLGISELLDMINSRAI